MVRAKGMLHLEESQDGKPLFFDKHKLPLRFSLALRGVDQLLAFGVLLAGSVFALLQIFKELSEQKSVFSLGRHHCHYKPQYNYYSPLRNICPILMSSYLKPNSNSEDAQIQIEKRVSGG
jgi:Ni,Fe-hydrogenase III small subunit